MSDARSLLRKAKAAESEKRINHPLALYNSSGQLRCAACGTSVKPHAWDGHVGSKAHRTQAARLRAEEEKERARKRKMEEEVETLEIDEDVEGKKRRTDEPEPAPPGATPAPAATGGFPADFFSDPSRAPPNLGADEDEDDADEPMPPQSATNPPSALDDEFAAFAKAVLQPAIKSNSTDVYEQATTMAEPEMFNNQADGFPAGVAGAADGEGVQEQPEETEAQKRQRLEQEERELIMDRLRDEEAAQEEADDRVARLKARLESVRLERTQKQTAATGDTPMASASGVGTDKKALLKLLRGKKKAPPAS